jgi:hypothetical protein
MVEPTRLEMVHEEGEVVSDEEDLPRVPIGAIQK